VMFWRAAIDAHVAVARSRLGDQDVATQLQATLEQARSNSERYLMVRCIDALAEICLAAGDTGRCRAHADELLAIAEANGLRELEASARRWRGEAWLVEQAYEQAHTELTHTSALAKDIGRVRLQMDAEHSLARLLRAQGRSDDAQPHAIRARAIAEAIAQSLVSSELEGRFEMVDSPR
jgi:tetratricopeptide (TPR) repeat protein